MLVRNLEGQCPTCKHYAKNVHDYPCCFCNDACNMYEDISGNLCKYDVKIHYLNDHKAEIFGADQVETLGAVLLVIKGDRRHYYPIYQITHYEIIEKEVDPNGDDTSNK